MFVAAHRVKLFISDFLRFFFCIRFRSSGGVDRSIWFPLVHLVHSVRCLLARGDSNVQVCRCVLVDSSKSEPINCRSVTLLSHALLPKADWLVSAACANHSSTPSPKQTSPDSANLLDDSIGCRWHGAASFQKAECERVSGGSEPIHAAPLPRSKQHKTCLLYTSPSPRDRG